MGKKIILSVTNDLVTDQRLNKVACSLQNAGYSVLLIGRKLKNSPDSDILKFKSIRFSLIFNNGPLFYLEFNLYLFIYLISSNFDILVSNDLDTLPANFLAAKLRSREIVYDSHEYFTEVPELVDRPGVKAIWEKLEYWILPSIKKSYTVCESIADIYNNKYGINMQVVRNVPLCNKTVDIQAEIPNIKGKKIIIYQGALNIGRGIELVIRAMKHVDNAIFIIIGDGDIKNELIELVEKESLSAKVVFLGRILIHNLPSYTALADIGISLEENLGLNYYYALPNKLFDYINSGIPILASDLPEIKKIVESNEIGIIIDDRAPENVAEKIKFMLSNTTARNKWKNNLSKIKDHYCWEKEEKILLDIYKSIQI